MNFSILRNFQKDFTDKTTDLDEHNFIAVQLTYWGHQPKMLEKNFE